MISLTAAGLTFDITVVTMDAVCACVCVCVLHGMYARACNLIDTVISL